MKNPCEEFADEIVDYVDGELPEDEARAVASHLTECERCRATAQALQRSLGLAQVLWSDNLAESESAAQSTRERNPHRIRFYAVAASIFVATSILMFTATDHRPRQPSMDFEEVKRQITRAGAAAELLAATRILAHCEGTETIVERQYQFILQEYAGTPAAETIRARYGSPSGGTQ